jgi:hypothetical protein
MLMAHIIVVSILLGIWLLVGFPRRKRVPNGPKRTPKRTIIFRMGIIPFAVVAFWGLMFCIADLEIGFYFVLGGVGAIVFAIGFLWAFTNICTFLYSPTYYRLWKKGGGDPFFDSLDSPLNNDPPSVRYQELYREKARQELEELFPPPAVPDFTRSIDDSNII